MQQVGTLYNRFSMNKDDFLFCVIRRGSNCRLFDVLPLDSLTKEYIYGGIQNKMGPIMICCTSYKAATAVK